MRLVWACCAVLVLSFYGNAIGAEPAVPPLKPWILRQTTFIVPFTADLSHGVPTEVQLFVSQDAGKNWDFYARQAPTAEHFSFRAAGDGDFWFASRAISPQRSASPVERLRPEMHVRVDTTQPLLELTATAGPAGEVKTAWKVADPTLDPNSLKIEYQASPGAAWRTVAIDHSKSWSTPGSLIGEMTWYPEGNSAGITVRAEASDSAENKSVVTRQVTRSMAATPPSLNPNTSTVATTPVAQISQATGRAQSARDSASYAYKPTSGGTTWPTDNKLRSNVSPSTPETPVNQAEQPTTEVESQSIGNAASQPTRTSLPPGERARMTNSLHFQLDYELDSVGPAGVAEVQLWGSTDFGQTWARWSVDEDLHSPLDVEVEREGIYGLRVVIVGRNGLATPAPHAGDLADIWVGVDTTRPNVRISSASYGEGVHAGELDIRWEVIDESIGDRGVTLMFSEQPTGPWTTIAAGLPNTKQYYWSVDPNTPRLIYLRLEFRDEAGNTGEHQLVEPISTKGLVPKAFIRSVRPVEEKPREAFLRNRYYESR